MELLTCIHTLFLVQEKQVEGDPELVEDAEFYQQLLKEFFETIDPASSGIVLTCVESLVLIFLKSIQSVFTEISNLAIGAEAAFYAMKKFQTKKRKVVDRRASKSRKIRYSFEFGLFISIVLRVFLPYSDSLLCLKTKKKKNETGIMCMRRLSISWLHDLPRFLQTLQIC